MSERQRSAVTAHAPHIDCLHCSVAMTVLTIIPAAGTSVYTAKYKCSKCGTETQREFTVLEDD